MMSENSADPSNNFRAADMAMYAAKAGGRNSFQFYDQTMRETVERRHFLQNNLRQAIENKELSLLCQPQVNDAGELIDAEVLLRWKNADLGHVSPIEFIPVAEQTGLIHSIGCWVLENALAILVSWPGVIEKIPHFKLALNVSSKQFQNRNFVSQVKQAIEV